MSFLACTKTGACVRGYPATRYLGNKCAGCAFATEIDGGDNAPRKADGMPLTEEEKSKLYGLKK